MYIYLFVYNIDATLKLASLTPEITAMLKGAKYVAVIKTVYALNHTAGQLGIALTE